MTFWFYVRLAVVIGAGVAACFGPLVPRATPPIGWGALLIIFGALIIGLPLVLSVQIINPRTAWTRPSWATNPFNFSDPLQFFHLGAYVCLAGGLVSLLRMQFSSSTFYLESLVPVAMGSGALLGIRAVELIYRSKFREPPNNRWSGP